jgi:SAM-dependent methyltransferase
MIVRYDTRMEEQSSYWSQKPARSVEKNAFADVCAASLSGTESVLDLGCGRGEDTLYLARRGCTVTAVDISATNVTHVRDTASRQGLDVTVLQHDIAESLPFGDASFDVVYAHLSLHYFDDPTTKRLFGEIRRVLKPAGFLFAKCKSVNDPLYGKGEKVGPDMFLEDHVRHFFSEEYMRECLKDFDVVRIEKTASVYVDYESAFVEAIARKPLS